MILQMAALTIDKENVDQTNGANGKKRRLLNPSSKYPLF